MGSMKYQISVSSTAMHLMNSSDNLLLAAAKAAVASGEDMMSAVQLTSFSGNLNSRMDSAFKYAEDTYTLALPGGVTAQTTLPSETDIANAIASDTGYNFGIVVTEYYYTSYQPMYEVLDYLLTERLLDIKTNAIHKWDGLSFSDGQWMVIVDSHISNDDLEIILVYDYYEAVIVATQDYEGQLITIVEWQNTRRLTETIARPNTTNLYYEDPCLIVHYLKLDNFGAELAGVYRWIYRVHTNTYPTLNNNVYTQHTSRYFPVVPIRTGNADLTADTYSGTDLYKTSKELLRIIGIPFKYLGDQINANPDVGQIDNAYVMFGADLQTNNKHTLGYLNYYFNYLSSINTTAYSIEPTPDNPDVDYWSATFTEGGLVLRMSYSHIDVSYIPGKIENGAVGNARKVITHVSYPAVEGNWSDAGWIGDPGSPAYTDTVLVLDLQISKTTIRRVSIDNLKITNYICGYNLVTTTMDTLQTEPNNHSCIIPLERDIMLMFEPTERSLIYAECALLVATSIERTKLDWYAQDWFAPLVMLTMVVIMIVSIIYFQPEIGVWIDGAIEAATTGVEAFIIYVALTVGKALLIAMIIGYAAKFIISIVGIEIGVIIAVVVAAVAFATGQVNTGAKLLAQYFSMTPQLLLSISTALIDAANTAVQAGIANLESNYDAFTSLLQKEYEALNNNTEIQALHAADDLDPYSVLRRRGRFIPPPIESPDAFYNRTLNFVDNSYYSVHGQISNFANSLLTINVQNVITV